MTTTRIERRSDSMSQEAGASWHTALLVILSICPPVVAASKRFIDGAVRRQDLFGAYYWDTTGSRTRYVTLGLTFMVLIALFNVYIARIHNHSRITSQSRAFSLYLLPTLATVILRGTSPLSVVSAVIILIALHACSLMQASTVALLRIARVALAVLLTNIVFVVGLPGIGTAPCRSDGKCGLFGSLWNGYFPQENFLAIYATISLPILLYLRTSWGRLFAFGLASVVIAGTGSRVALFSVAFALLVLNRSIWRGWSSVRIPPVFKWIAVIGFAISGILFYTITGTELTGRGVIWQAVRAELVGWDLWIGPGNGALLDAFQVTHQLPFLPTHEHGQFPHIIGSTGLIGVCVFTLLLGVIAIRVPRRGESSLPHLILLVAASLFLTETLFQLQIEDASLWGMALLASHLGSVDARPGSRGQND